MHGANITITLLTCFCVILTTAPSALADFVGITTVIKDDADTTALCTEGGGQNVPGPLTVCNVFAVFDDPSDILLGVAEADLQVDDGENPDVFYFHPFGNPPISPQCNFLPVFPDLICTSFVAIGIKCAPAAPAADDTTPDGDFESGEFAFEGHIVGGWFNANPPGGQGDAGNYPNLQVLFLQSSVAQGLSMSGVIRIIWEDGDTGDQFVETHLPLECAAAAPAPIPTVSEWGLIIMTLLALTAGTIVFARRRKTAMA